MYIKTEFNKTTLNSTTKTEGETIELKVKRLINNKEPIKDAAPLIFTERSKGVNAAYNIRTDRWEIATEMMDAIHKSKAAKKEDMGIKEKDETKVIKGDFGKAEPTAGTLTGSDT